MGDDDKGGASSWYKVPVWDGSPAIWRAFRREMNWWTQSLNLEETRKYNLAARWLLRQSGTVKARGEEFDPADLQYQKQITATDPQSEEEVVIQEEDMLAGLNKLHRALEEMNGKTALDRKAELRTSFSSELRRKPGERLSEFCTRFRSLVGELRQEGVALPSSELGWFLKDKMGLDALRRQLLETALQGAENYENVEAEVLRLFKDLHLQDPLHRRSEQRSTDGKASLLNRFLNPSGSSTAVNNVGRWH